MRTTNDWERYEEEQVAQHIRAGRELREERFQEANAMSKKLYLGDGVYAENDGYAIKLTTDQGVEDTNTNTIYLEPEVLQTLILFSNSCVKDEV